MSIENLPLSPTLNPPKYWQWAEELHRQIQAGELKPGDPLPSIREMKARYGVSRPVMDRIHVQLEKRGLIVREPGRGVFVAATATVPSRGKLNGVLGISIPGVLQDHPYYTTLMRGAQRVCRAEGAELLITHEASAIRWEKVDGMLLVAPQGETEKRLPPGMPAVSLLFKIEHLPSVITDDYQAMKTLTEHLISLGHRRIGYMSAAFRAAEDRHDAPYVYGQAEVRRDGYLAALQGAGITPDPAWTHHITWCGALEGELTEDEISGRETMRLWFREGWKDLGCTALLVQNDGTAMGVIEALQEASIRVPQDLSIAGFDGVANYSHFRPSLTTMKVPLEEIGATGTRLLLNRVRMPLEESEAVRTRLPAHKMLAATLKIGGSSAAI